MDYSDRVNSKKGAGGIASAEDANIHTKKRVQELLATHILDIENDPYVFRNHLGLLECRLCLTTHNNEASYISHLGGRKHHVNLERRRVLDEKQHRQHQYQQKINEQISISNIEKRSWKKIGQPEYKISKIRDPETDQVGLIISVKVPKITVEEPIFRFMSYFELTSKNQNMYTKYVEKMRSDNDGDEEEELNESDNQLLIISAEPYENIAIVLPNKKEIEKPQGKNEMSDKFWWVWDNDTKEFVLQMLYKK
ncbi:sap62 [Candida oxycetoniae]|uniref:Sap62 n=1 Tax=Candida oxycetoniae TaxID=497107 RepID=A0AAI9STL4_9ASCO|nr:sap62 [Candida oxycetoniae]KAI3402795.1 sap62 [Candida oxycetoniae]